MSNAAYDDSNIFAKILRGEIPCHKLYEDDETFAFMDIMPRGDGHCQCPWGSAPGGVALVCASCQSAAPGDRARAEHGALCLGGVDRHDQRAADRR